MWDTFLAGRAENHPVEHRGIPHLAKNERDMGHPLVGGRERSPNNTVSSPRGSAKRLVNFTESRMKIGNATSLDRKSGTWGTLLNLDCG
jgi:hypothetical protein